MKQQLENMMDSYKPMVSGQKVYVVGDLESLSATGLYTGHLPKMGPGGFGLPKLGDSYGVKTPIFKTPLMNSNPIGSVSNFEVGSYKNIFENLDLGKLFPKDKDAQGVNLQLRYDLAERNEEKPHLNLGLTKKKGYFPLGDIHKINLF